MADIAQQLHKVEQRILSAAQAAGRERSSIQLLAVSKTRPVEDLLAALDTGIHRFGESYLQEAIPKIEQLCELRPQAELEWHFIGPIQSNKTRPIAEHFDWVHSVERLKIAQRLNEHRQGLPPLNICLQVNISAETSKSGARLEELDTLVDAISALPNLRLRGLMAIPAPAAELAQQRIPFHALAQLLEEQVRRGHPLDTLSMGMSSDLEAAILEGATIVRIGTDLFGARPGRQTATGTQEN